MATAMNALGLACLIAVGPCPRISPSPGGVGGNAGPADGPAAELERARRDRDLGRREGAVGHYRRALELDPRLAAVGPEAAAFYREFGEALLRAGRASEAREVLGDAIGTLDDPGLLELFGRACLESGDLDAAGRAWLRAAERAPGSVGPWRTLGRIRLKERRAEDALPYLRRALAVAPDDYETLSLLAAAHRVLGRREEAIAFEVRAGEARRALPPSRSGMGADTDPAPP